MAEEKMTFYISRTGDTDSDNFGFAVDTYTEYYPQYNQTVLDFKVYIKTERSTTYIHQIYNTTLWVSIGGKSYSTTIPPFHFNSMAPGVWQHLKTYRVTVDHDVLGAFSKYVEISWSQGNAKPRNSWCNFQLTLPTLQRPINSPTTQLYGKFGSGESMTLKTTINRGQGCADKIITRCRTKRGGTWQDWSVYASGSVDPTTTQHNLTIPYQDTWIGAEEIQFTAAVQNTLTGLTSPVAYSNIIGAESTMKVWTGSAWDTAVIKIWNGSAWVTGKLWVKNG